MTPLKCSCVPLCLLALLLPSWVHAEDLHTELMRATVKIKHDKAAGTGFVLWQAKQKRFLLVTAAHVFPKTSGDEVTAFFRTQVGEGEYKKEPLKVVVRKDGKPLWTQHPTEDVAVIEVVPPKNADLPQIPVELLASDELLKKHQVHPGEQVACLGYPHRNESSDAGFAILRLGAIASYPLVPTAKNKTFLLSANSVEGDSGGPVYLSPSSRPAHDQEEVRLIVGLISAQRFIDEDMKMIYGETKVRHRLGLAIVVPASFILQTIDRLP
jgi:hypothetical protein